MGDNLTRTRREDSALQTPLRIALVGCGEVCEHKHLPALRRVRSARVVAVADPDASRRARVAERFGIPHQFPNVHALLSAGVADVIGVLVPPAQHVETALAALGAGCHVLIEKPLALALDEVDALVAAERAATGRVLMGFHMRWHRLVRRAREAARLGALGEAESIRAIWSSPRGDDGIPGWKCARITGGGSLVELSVHLFDLWRFLLGTEILEVFAVSRHGQRDDESALVTGKLANGMLASALISERTSHDIEIEICGDRGRLRVACQRFDGFEWYGLHETAGMAGPRLRSMSRALRELPLGLSRLRRLGDYGDSYRGQWQHFVDAIAGGGSPECTVQDGRAALRAVLAAAASASCGAPVAVDCAPRTIADVAPRG